MFEFFVRQYRCEVRRVYIFLRNGLVLENRYMMVNLFYSTRVSFNSIIETLFFRSVKLLYGSTEVYKMII